MTRPKTPIRTLAALLSLGLCAGAALAKDTGYLFVSSENDNAVTVLDGKSFQVVKAIATGERPRDMKLSADRSQVFVIASNSERVDVIDIAKLEVVRSIDVGEDPEMFDFSKDGSRIYVSNEEDAEAEDEALTAA